MAQILAAAIPGLSFTPIKVTLESFFVKDTPRIILLLTIFFLLVIKVPEDFLNDDLTSISIYLTSHLVLNVVA